MGLFGKSKPGDPKEKVQEWCKKIRKEGYNLDRQINSIKREENKAIRSLKESAKRGDKESSTLLAKEIINSRLVGLWYVKLKNVYLVSGKLSTSFTQQRQILILFNYS